MVDVVFPRVYRAILVKFCLVKRSPGDGLDRRLLRHCVLQGGCGEPCRGLRVGEIVDRIGGKI